MVGGRRGVAGAVVGGRRGWLRGGGCEGVDDRWGQCGDYLSQLWGRLANDNTCAWLDNPRFLLGDPTPPTRRAVGVVTPNIGDHRDLTIDHIGRVESPEHADFNHRHFDCLVCEVQKSSCCDGLKPAERSEFRHLHKARYITNGLTERWLVEFYSRYPDSFTRRRNMWARVEPNPQSHRCQQRFNHPCG